MVLIIVPSHLSYKMSGRLNGKVAIVTGGALGFGEGIVIKFVQEGALVVIVDLHKENGERVLASQPRGTAIFVQGDVSSEQDWEKVRDTTLSRFGKIDIVVNNAGIVNSAIVCMAYNLHRILLTHEQSSLELTEKEFDRLCRVNIKSLYFSARVIAPCIQKQGTGGAFINISSMSALRPRPNLVWYAATKGAASAVCLIT
jgi:3-oxoacyl-[acyl-carrier protein] reductase